MTSTTKSSLKFAYIFLVISIIWIFLIHLEYLPETDSSRFKFFDQSWLVGILTHPTNPTIWGAFIGTLLINNLFNIPAIIIIFLNKSRKKTEIIKTKAKNAQIIWVIIFLFTLIIS